MSEGPLVRSSTFWRGAGVALLAALPGVGVVTWLTLDAERSLLDEGLEQLAFQEMELVEAVFEETFGELVDLDLDLADLDLDDLGLEEIESESFARFLTRYVTTLERARALGADPRALDLRLALLGEAKVEGIDTLPLGRLVDQVLDETPESFHDALLGMIETRFDLDDDLPLDGLDRLSSRDLAEPLAELSEDAWEEEGLWLELVDATGRRLVAPPEPSVEASPMRSQALLLRVDRLEIDDDPEPWEDAEEIEAGWVLVRDRTLEDDGRVRVGIPFDHAWQRIRMGRALRWGLWLLLVPWSLLLAARQARPMQHFLDTLGEVARRQTRGRAGARLRTRGMDADLAGAAMTLNETLDHLDHSVQALARVGDSIAHDLRTPLSRLQGQLDLLRRHPDATGELIDAVQGEADQLLGTFNALLRIAQVESGHKKQGFRNFDLAETVADVAELYGPVFGEKGVAFAWQGPDRRVDILGDRDLWLQALSNLVENALKYTPSGGRVDLRLATRGRRAHILLRDTGPGIPEPERDNVFQRFYRLERHRGERGNGLGLSLVAAVCELHDAAITLGGEGGLTVEIVLG